MGVIGNFAAAGVAVALMNGRIKPKKKGFATYLGLIFELIAIIVFTIVFLYGVVTFNFEYIFFGIVGTISFVYMWLISAYTQSSKNYYLKVQNPSSFENIELYYKKKRVNLKYVVDNEGKFKWAKDDAKLECVSYFDGTNMSNFTKYRILNYFSAWLLDNEYLSKEVTVSFEKL